MATWCSRSCYEGDRRRMARKIKQGPRGPVLDLHPVIEKMGLSEVIDQVGLKRVIEAVGAERVLQEKDLNKVVEEMGPDWFLARLTPEHCRELQERLR